MAEPRGSRAPVFGVPGHNGDVFCYRFLAQQLGDDQPFFGLQPPGAAGQGELLTRVEDLAAYFATQIRAYRPNDAYVITGYCAGGTIAFELARQLLQQGATIRFVALFTSPYSTAFGRLPQLNQRLASYAERVRTHARVLASSSNRERRLYIRERLREYKARRDAPPDPVQVQRAKVEAATVAAIRRYTPRYFDGRLRLFLPNKEWLRPGSPMLRWQDVARETKRYVGPDGCIGDHMLLEHYVARIADLFRSCRYDVELGRPTPRAAARPATPATLPRASTSPAAGASGTGNSSAWKISPRSALGDRLDRVAGGRSRGPFDQRTALLRALLVSRHLALRRSVRSATLAKCTWRSTIARANQGGEAAP